MSAHNILVIDDHAMFRCGLCMVLQAHMPDAAVVEVASLDEAMRASLIDPTLILLDIELQGLNGLECIAVLKGKWPQTPIIMLSSHANPAMVRQSIARGAAAFVAKADSADMLVGAITQVLQRSPAGASVSDDAPRQVVRLTPRQLEVLDLLSQGMPNKTIGRRLGLSEHTVRGHVQALLDVLQVSSRSEAAFVARRLGLIT
jgi:DNA-binding NarL/FixJ family response regulator